MSMYMHVHVALPRAKATTESSSGPGAERAAGSCEGGLRAPRRTLPSRAVQTRSPPWVHEAAKCGGSAGAPHVRTSRRRREGGDDDGTHPRGGAAPPHRYTYVHVASWLHH